MRIRAMLALVCSFLLFAGVVACILLPQIWLSILRIRRSSSDASLVEKTVSWHNNYWGSRVFRWVCSIMRIKVEWQNLEAMNNGPAIIIANHVTPLDFLAVYAIANGHDLRWIIKREIMNWPAMGRIAKWAGVIPVARNRDPHDLELVTDGARRAGQAGAFIMNFVESHRFTGAKPGSGLRNLLPPKHGGFDRLIDELPDYGVVDITFAYRPRPPAGKGRTVTDGAALYGRTILIRLDSYSPLEVRRPGWLTQRWQQKDLLLDIL